MRQFIFKLAFLLCFLRWTVPGWAVPTLVNHTKQCSSDGNGFTTSPGIDTTGADFIAVEISSNGTPTLSDNKSITYTALTVQMDATTTEAGFYKAGVGGSTGSGHTWTVTGGSTFACIFVLAFSGIKTTSALTSQAGNFDGVGDASIQCGSVTPATSGDLIVSYVAANASTFSINSSFTATETNDNTGNARGGGIAYKVVTAAENPTWSFMGSPHSGCTNGAFAQAVSAATSNRLMLLGAP